MGRLGMPGRRGRDLARPSELEGKGLDTGRYGRNAKILFAFATLSLTVERYRSWVDFRFTGGSTAVLNEESTMVMLNANKVNGPRQNFFLPQFCESFCDSGRILHFKKSVKYSGSSKINGVLGLLN